MQENKKETLIVNLIGAPSTCKTTIMGDVFSALKWLNINSEIVTEFAKDLVWAKRFEDMKDEIYIFAKQNHRLFTVCGKVDVVVTDRPLLLTVVYNNRYGDGGEELNKLVLKEFNKHNNLNILLNRVHDYSPIGRVQTEEEADEIATSIKELLDENNIEYIELDGCKESVEKITEEILKRLGKIEEK